MLCIPEQLFNSAHTAESKGLFMRPGLFTYVHWLSACTLFYLLISLISQHTVSVFYLHSSAPCIKIVIKDNTVRAFIWSSLLCLYVHDSHYAKRAPKFSRTFELFDGIQFLNKLYYFLFMPLSRYCFPLIVSAR